MMEMSTPSNTGEININKGWGKVSVFSMKKITGDLQAYNSGSTEARN